MTRADVIHDDAPTRGAFHIDDAGKRIAEQVYDHVTPGLIVIVHTFVDPSARGEGLAGQVMDALIKWARETKTRVRAECTYAKRRFAEDDSIRDVLE